MLWLDPSRVSADGNNLRYAGRVGTGFTDTSLRDGSHAKRHQFIHGVLANRVRR